MHSSSLSLVLLAATGIHAQQISYLSGNIGSSFTLWSAAEDGSERRQLAFLSGSYVESSQDFTLVSWSPDGQAFVYNAWVGGVSDIFRMSIDGSDSVNLTNSPAKDDFPAWSPDGRRIAFSSDRDNPRGDIFVMNADGSGLLQIRASSMADAGPSWSADGTRILFMSQPASRPFLDHFPQSFFGKTAKRHILLASQLLRLRQDAV